MKFFVNTGLCAGALVVFCASQVPAQTSLSGYVRTMTGVPIANATVKLVIQNNTAATDDSGFYDFGKTKDLDYAVRNRSNASIALFAHKNELLVTSGHAGQAIVRIFDVAGRMAGLYRLEFSSPGTQSVFIGDKGRSNTMYLATVTAEGSGTKTIRLAYCQGTIAGPSLNGTGQKTEPGLFKTSAVAASDSIVVTHPEYWGGLDFLNTRKITPVSGTQNFRLFSKDTSASGWFSSPMNFIFTPDTVGVSDYKKLVPDYAFEEQETQREVEQCIWRNPSEVPANKRYSVYNVDINATVSYSPASTAGNTLYLAPGYVPGQSWWEILGVQHHEMVHSYQPWYDMTGATGFGESMPDAIRCLTGFFYWPAQTKCSGGYNQAYQGGAQYWYYIELKHPGFIYGLYKLTSTTNIKTAVKQVTGESLDTLCKECETKGMPYTLGRGSF